MKTLILSLATLVAFIVTGCNKPDNTPASSQPSATAFDQSMTTREFALQARLSEEQKALREQTDSMRLRQEREVESVRAYAEKLREANLKAEKQSNGVKTLEKLVDINVRQQTLLAQIAKQKPTVVTNNIVFHAPALPAITNIVHVTATSAPPTIVVNPATVTNHVHVAPAVINPQTMVTNHITVQPAPVKVVITNVTTAWVSSGTTTQAVVSPKPAPVTTNTPPAPKPVKVKATKAPAPAPVVVTPPPAEVDNRADPVAEAMKVKQVSTIARTNTVTLAKGLNEWKWSAWAAKMLDKNAKDSLGGQEITRIYALKVKGADTGDLAFVENALDVFLAEKQGKLADNTDFVDSNKLEQQARLQLMFIKFLQGDRKFAFIKEYEPLLEFKVTAVNGRPPASAHAPATKGKKK
ncbi:hypothetical protein EPO17_02980 [Patescibacteria group bacterium]|nr:MAG: hypothetical protein EPO17_02980 [Patescibacteria group bacterium]